MKGPVRPAEALRPRPAPRLRTRTRPGLLAAALLAGCSSLPSITESGSRDAAATQNAPSSILSRLMPDVATSPDAGNAAAPAGPSMASAPATPLPITPAFRLQPAEVKAMLIRADPRACSATSDARPAEIAATYAKIGILFGSKLVVTSATDDAALQRTLDEFRPYLRELSRNTTWLPIAAERSIGDQLYSSNHLQPFTPPARQRKLLDQSIKPIFEQLVRFAQDDLKSPIAFELRVVRDDAGTSPSAIAGGIVIVPSGMFSAMGRVKQPDEVIAFMLAHEFSHVLRRHKTKMVQLSLVDSMTMASEYRQLAAGAKSGFSAARGLDQQFQFSKRNVASLMELTCKSRNWLPSMEQSQEYEADVCGSLLLRKLSAARHTPYDAARGYAQYLSAGLAARISPAQEGQCTVKTSHPDPAQRMQNLRAYAADSTAAP